MKSLENYNGLSRTTFKQYTLVIPREPQGISFNKIPTDFRVFLKEDSMKLEIELAFSLVRGFLYTGCCTRNRIFFLFFSQRIFSIEVGGKKKEVISSFFKVFVLLDFLLILYIKCT